MAKVIMDIYQGGLFYVAFADFGIGDRNLTRHHKGCEVVSVPQKLVHIKDGRLSYPLGAKATINGSHFNAVLFKPTPDALKKITKQESFKESDKAVLRKDWSSVTRQVWEPQTGLSGIARRVWEHVERTPGAH